MLLATFIIAVAGLIYELIAATVSSYLVGDSVRQFSLVIGVFLSSMGLGAWMSRFVGNALRGFVWSQILIGLVGGFMAPALFLAYAHFDDVSVLLLVLLLSTGALAGMEIPLITRVLKQIGAEEFRFENVLTVDYAGALVASLAFPLLVVPHLGLMSASLTFGALNLIVAGATLWLFRDQVARAQVVVWAIALVMTLGALVQSERLVAVSEARFFEDDIILSETTPYQQITITRFRERTRLYLNHAIQFDTLDEYRYHEMLVHPAMGLAAQTREVLILGGGDGMAAREVLRHADVAQITLVDLDPRVTELFRTNDALAALNDHALRDPRVRILNMDAWQFIEQDQGIYDVVILDLPDPKNLTLSKLYTRQFYNALAERLGAGSVVVTQAGAPLFARQAFWSVAHTWEAVRNPLNPGALNVLPYHAYVPSFGEWGFVMASPLRLDRTPKWPEELRFLNTQGWEQAQVFAPDMARLEVQVNDIQTHPLVEYYLDGWARWFE